MLKLFFWVIIRLESSSISNCLDTVFLLLYTNPDIIRYGTVIAHNNNKMDPNVKLKPPFYIQNNLDIFFLSPQKKLKIVAKLSQKTVLFKFFNRITFCHLIEKIDSPIHQVFYTNRHRCFIYMHKGYLSGI